MARYDGTELSDDKLLEDFKLIDYDGDGYVELWELKLIVMGSSLENVVAETDMQELIFKTDKDNDGKVSLEEFKAARRAEEATREANIRREEAARLAARKAEIRAQSKKAAGKR